jgi:NAD(P)H-dependent FMN reductase
VASPTGDPVNLAVIIGSTREGRFGETVSRWLTGWLEDRLDIKLDVIDLIETPLPAALQRAPAALGEYAAPEVRDFAARIDAADAFIAVTPEYNHGYPASLKLAFDSVGPEWYAKPIGFVSYGGYAGGLRAVEQLRLVVSELHMVPVRDTVSFHMAPFKFGDDGRPLEPAEVDAAARVMVDRLTWWARALREAKAREPY